jgi:hypothetical protein
MSHSLSILPADVAITFAIQFVIVIFLFVAFLLLVVKFFKLSYRALAALVSSLSFSLPIRLISLSIATWLFPELPKFILFLLFNLFSFFFIDLPKTLLPGLKAASGQCLATDPGVCLAIVSDAVYRSWLDVITPFFSKVDSYNVSVLSIVLFFTSAIVSSLLIEYLVGSSGGQFPALRLARQLPQLRETIPQPRRNGIFLVLILAAAGYLSLASVIAIPSLKSETLPDAVAPDRLRAQLEEASFTEAQMASLYPDAILGATVDLAVLKQRTDSFSAFLASYANAQLQERDQLQSDWSALRQHYFRASDRIGTCGREDI